MCGWYAVVTAGLGAKGNWRYLFDGDQYGGQQGYKGEMKDTSRHDCCSANWRRVVRLLTHLSPGGVAVHPGGRSDTVRSEVKTWGEIANPCAARLAGARMAVDAKQQAALGRRDNRSDCTQRERAGRSTRRRERGCWW